MSSCNPYLCSVCLCVVCVYVCVYICNVCAYVCVQGQQNRESACPLFKK